MRSVLLTVDCRVSSALMECTLEERTILTSSPVLEIQVPLQIFKPLNPKIQVHFLLEIYLVWERFRDVDLFEVGRTCHP